MSRTHRPITFTLEGEIPAIKVNDTWLVVKLRKQHPNNTKASGETNSLRAPMRDELGRLVYAVPGGGSYVP